MNDFMQTEEEFAAVAQLSGCRRIYVSRKKSKETFSFLEAKGMINKRTKIIQP